MATVKELKEIIIELKMDLVKANIPYGNCPYAYYPGIEGECSADISCTKCKQEFFEKYENKIRAIVEQL